MSTGLFTLVIFTVVFVGIAIWAYAPRNKDKMKDHGTIPFKEDSDGR